MADIFWPAGVADDPLKGTVSEAAVNDGDSFGGTRSAPSGIGTSYRVEASYPMSKAQYLGIWLPWWTGRKVDGGCEKGNVAFWLRTPYSRVPAKHIAQPGTEYKAVEDGLNFIITVSLLRLPS